MFLDDLFRYGGGDWPKNLVFDDVLGGVAGGAGIGLNSRGRQSAVTPEEMAILSRQNPSGATLDQPLTMNQLMRQEGERERQAPPPSLFPEGGPSFVPNMPDIPSVAQDLWNQAGTATAGLLGLRTPLTQRSPRQLLEVAPSPRDRQFEQAPMPRGAQGAVLPAIPQLTEVVSPEVAPSPREAEAPEQAPMPSPAGRHQAVGDWERQMAALPQLQPGEYQAAPVHPDDRRQLTPLEQRLQEMTGVAYGQSPMQFDPRLRAQVQNQLDQLAVPNAEMALRRELLGMQGNQEMDRLRFQMGGQERMQEAENRNRMGIAEMQFQPNQQQLRVDALMKIVAASLNADPTGASLGQVLQQFTQNVWPQLQAMQNPNMPQGIPPLGGLPGNADRDAATQTLNAMRALISRQQQNASGQTENILNEEMLQPMMTRVAQIYGQANLSPAAKAQFLQNLGMGSRGGLGDPNRLRAAAALELAKLHLQANPQTGVYPDTMRISDPNDPSRVLLELGRQPRSELAQGAVDFYHWSRRNPTGPVTFGGSSFLNDARAIPYDLITIPGSGTIPFDRTDVEKLGGFGMGASRENAKRNIDAMLRFAADIAQQQLQPPR